MSKKKNFEIVGQLEKVYRWLCCRYSDTNCFGCPFDFDDSDSGICYLDESIKKLTEAEMSDDYNEKCRQLAMEKKDIEDRYLKLQKDYKRLNDFILSLESLSTAEDTEITKYSDYYTVTKDFEIHSVIDLIERIECFESKGSQKNQ